MIYTSYFGNLKNLPDMTFYSISGKTPEWFENILNKDTRKYKSFAPKYSWWKEWHDKFLDDLESPESVKWYENMYKITVLDKLDIKKVILDLKLDTMHKDVCLLCYETPDKFCHRHIVSKWLNDNGIACKEFDEISR